MRDVCVGVGLFVVACTPGVFEETGESDVETGVGHTGGDARVDVDEDGYDATVDCDDYNPSINPGAKEDWDLVDNDCDGRVDANGVYAGTASLSLRVVYEGTLRRWSVPCSGELVRETTRVDVTITCAIVEADDPLAITVLGEQIIIREVDNFVERDTFGGAFDISSDTDWNTDASGSLIWVSLQKARGQITASAKNLQLDGTWTFERTD